MKPSLPKIISNEKGMVSFMVGIIGIGCIILAVALLGLTKGSDMGGADGLRFYSAVDVIKANIYFFGQNEDAWNATLAYNRLGSRMMLIDTGSDCVVNASTSSDEEVDLALPGPSLYYDDDSATLSGFRYSGEPCPYNQARVVAGCAIQVDLRWRPFCNDNCPCGEDYNRIVFHGFWRTPDANPATNSNRDSWGYKFRTDRVDGIIAF